MPTPTGEAYINREIVEGGQTVGYSQDVVDVGSVISSPYPSANWAAIQSALGVQSESEAQDAAAKLMAVVLGI